MAKDTKFIARYDGKIVGTRRSPRPYAFAIVAQNDEATARRAAYDHQPTATDVANFEWDTFKATCTPDADVRPPGWRHSTKFTKAEIEASQGRIAGDWPAYIARVRETRIRWFEENVTDGRFEPRAVAWSMSRANAEKAARGFPGLLAIVPAEVA